MEIKDPRTGQKAYVNKEGRLFTQSLSLPIQAHQSINGGNSFQVWGEAIEPDTGTVNVLGLVNTSRTKKIMINFIRVQSILPSSVVPDAGEFFSISVGDSNISGGSNANVVNLNQSSRNEGDQNTYQGGFDVGSNGEVIDKYFPESNGKQETFRKEDSIILGANDSLTIKYTSGNNNIDGKLYARISYSFVDINNLI